MKKIICLLILTIMLISGCATGYHKVGFTGGYSEMKIQDDIFKVEFRGNAKTSMARAEDFALLRCAEVTLENGYRHFIIVDEKSTLTIGSYTTPATAHTHGSSYGGSYHATTTITGGETYIFNKPSTRNMIKCFKEKPEGIPTIVYDAEQIKTNIKNRYRVK